jgi:uncharacterized membrane protein YdbT with pleckstrin-like domain
MIKLVVKNENLAKISVHPLNKYMYKLWVYVLAIGSLSILSVYFVYYMISTSSSKFNPNNEWVQLFNLTFIPLTLLIMLFCMIIARIYTKTMEFQIFDNEVVVRKGVVNKTEKHVPFRTVTNISTRYGLLDKLFGIGTVEIETAGKSGQSPGPEEKIEGITNYVDMRDTILDELRKFRSQYTTGTEPAIAKTSDNDVASAILSELREIKTILQNQ